MRIRHLFGLGFMLVLLVLGSCSSPVVPYSSLILSPPWQKTEEVSVEAYEKLLSSYEDDMRAVAYQRQPDQHISTPQEPYENKSSLLESELEAVYEELGKIKPYQGLMSIDLEREVQEIALRYQALMLETMDPGPLFHYQGLTSWSSGSEIQDFAAKHSLLAAHLINSLDPPQLAVAYAAWVFLHDIQNSVSANNFASALVNAAERLYPHQSQRSQRETFYEDAHTCFLHAIAKSKLDHETWSLRSLVPLLNLGNLLVDMNAIDEALSVLVAARRLDPTSYAVALALATCYEAQGRTQAAMALMREFETVRLPQGRSMMQQMSTALEQTQMSAGGLSFPTEEAYRSMIEQLASEQILTSADFIASLDQESRNKVRYFLEHLAPKGSFSVPDIRVIAQYSSLEAVRKPSGQMALRDFSEAVASYTASLIGNESKAMSYQMENLGLDIAIQGDLDDMVQNPQKYEGTQVDVSVQGLEAMYADISEMEHLAHQAERELALGRTTSSKVLAAKIDPALSVFSLNPYDYADPMNVVVQQYNMEMLQRKLYAYDGYLQQVNKRVESQLIGIGTQAGRVVESIKEAQHKSIIRLNQEAKEQGVDTSASFLLRLHKEGHVDYQNRHNEAVENAFAQMSSIAVTAYLQQVKPNAEALYYDVIRHVCMVSDSSVRKALDIRLKETVHRHVATSLKHIAMAYTAFVFEEPWDCGCDIGQLLVDRAEEEQKLMALESERLMKNRGEKKRFDSGSMPESSPLFQKIDSYGTDLKIPFIPFMEGRISCARTQVTYTADFSSLGGPSLDYSYLSLASNGSTTHSGGVSYGFNMGAGGQDVAATFSIQGSVTTDGNAVVTDYHLSGNASLSTSLGPLESSVGGNVDISTGGVINYDMSSETTIGSNFGPIKAETTLEASVVRGNSLSGKVEMQYNTFNPSMDETSAQQLQTVKERFVDDSMLRKELFSGTFDL